jgi:hypothetical protein
MLWPPERQRQRRSCGTVRDVDRHQTSDSAARLNARVAEPSMTDKSDPSGIPSAPPIFDISKTWCPSGENCDTTLCHTVILEPSKKRSQSISLGSAGCDTSLYHRPSQRQPRPSSRSQPSRCRQSSGLILRGTIYYLRLRVPRHLVGIVCVRTGRARIGLSYRLSKAATPTEEPVCGRRPDL